MIAIRFTIQENNQTRGGWMKKITLVLASTAALWACTPVKTLTPEGALVKQVDKKPTDCKNLGDIDSSGLVLTREQSLNFIRNKAASEGADTFRIENEWTHEVQNCIGCPDEDLYIHKAYIYKCGK